MAARNGFIVRNAVDAGPNLDLAEPDALDFSLVGNLRYGVLRGCDLAISGWNVTVSTGVVVNNGSVLITGGQTSLATASQDARFDLISVDGSGTVHTIPGLPAPEPVFPDFGDNEVVLASVMVRPGITPPATTDMTDKRVFIAERTVTALDSGTFLGSYDPSTSAPKFTIEDTGKTTWSGDTRIYRTGIGVLKVETELDVGTLHASNDVIVDDDLTVGGDFSASNLQTGAGPPTGTGQPGWVYQNTRDGGLWTWMPGLGWQQLSVVPIPAGFVMASMLTVEPNGWLFCNGQTVAQSRAGGLWTAFPQWISGSSMTLPDLNHGAFLRGGTPGGSGGNATQTLAIANLPAHRHILGVATGSGGAHSHTATTDSVGAHGHNTSPDQGSHGHVLTDPGHVHNGADGGGGGAFIAAVWGGRRRIDGPFNDASHPVAVQEVAATVRASTGVQVVQGGAHSHWTDVQGWHTHNVNLSSTTADHSHTISEVLVGSSQPLNMLPPYGTVNWMIKT